MIGVLGGIGAFTFGYGNGWSYFCNHPQSCVNCHVMQDPFDFWQNSSHRHVAVCNDCHLSHHPNGKWVVKGDNGFFHSLAFTLENYHDPIQIKPAKAGSLRLPAYIATLISSTSYRSGGTTANCRLAFTGRSSPRQSLLLDRCEKRANRRSGDDGYA